MPPYQKPSAQVPTVALFALFGGQVFFALCSLLLALLHICIFN